MPRKPKVQRTPEEKWQIVLEGLKSGNVAETCGKYEIAATLYYRWRDEVEKGAKAALGGRSAGEADQAVGAGAEPLASADRDLNKRAGRVSCGQAHSSAREFVAQGKAATLVAETLEISGRVSTIGGGRAAGVRIVHATRRLSWPPAKSRLTVIVAWPGGWGGITGW
jgi:transposase-like protein